MKFLIDMNLSPKWVSVFRKAGYESIHWSVVGNHNALDHEILDWAKSNNYIIFTHDLDFGAILASKKSDCPSVIQIRTQNINPQNLGDFVISSIKQFQKSLEQGALISIDEIKARARILPLNE